MHPSDAIAVIYISTYYISIGINGLLTAELFAMPFVMGIPPA